MSFNRTGCGNMTTGCGNSTGCGNTTIGSGNNTGCGNTTIGYGNTTGSGNWTGGSGNNTGCGNWTGGCGNNTGCNNTTSGFGNSTGCDNTTTGFGNSTGSGNWTGGINILPGFQPHWGCGDGTAEVLIQNTGVGQYLTAQGLGQPIVLAAVRKSDDAQKWTEKDSWLTNVKYDGVLAMRDGKLVLEKRIEDDANQAFTIDVALGRIGFTDGAALTGVDGGSAQLTPWKSDDNQKWVTEDI